MKRCLLLSLLCGALAFCAAEAVPVEVAAEEEASEVSVPGENASTKLDDESVVLVPGESLLTEVESDASEPLAPEAVNAAVKSAPSLLANAPPPAPVVQGGPNTRCPHGWQQYNDACFLLMNLSYSWTNADAMCESLGASLASVHDLWEYSFLKQLTWRAGYLTAWIGGYRFQGFWKWDDGSAFDYNNWYYLQSSSYDCVFLNSQESRGWSSERCNLFHPFICSTRLTHC